MGNHGHRVLRSALIAVAFCVMASGVPFDSRAGEALDARVTAHNVRESRGRRGGGWQAEYLAHVREIPDMETMLHPEARAGIAITCKR